MRRRTFLGLAGVAVIGGCTGDGSTAETVERIPYGDAPRQFVELQRPPGTGPFPTVVLLHGGFWSNRYRLGLMNPLRDDLVSAASHAVVNVEYRSVGDDGGGWPGTLLDAAAAVDVLDLQPSLDLAAVTVVGHSAGGQLAAWLAGRPSLPASAPGASPAVVPARVACLAGVLDLISAADERLGAGACEELLGGRPDEVPDRYAVASPAALLPYSSDVICVHGDGDRHVPASQSEHFVEAANATGTTAALLTGAGDHFDVIDPRHDLWRSVRDLVLGR